MRCAMVICFLSGISLAISANAENADYDKPDAGCLIYSVGSIKLSMKFAFQYHRLVENHDKTTNYSGVIEPKRTGFDNKSKRPDFTGHETGNVITRCLPPGIYEVHSFSFQGFIPSVAHVTTKSAKPFSLPFHIRSGEATYIGSFMRAPSLPTSLRPILGAKGFFVIADRSERDLALVQKKLPSGMPITKEVTDVSIFENPMLRTVEP